jgi:hypothetical protein
LILLLDLTAQPDNSTPLNPMVKQWDSDVRSQVKRAKKTPDIGYLMVHSDSGWSATMLESSLDSVTKDGSGNSII